MVGRNWAHHRVAHQQRLQRLCRYLLLNGASIYRVLLHPRVRTSHGHQGFCSVTVELHARSNGCLDH
ncbi:MAG: hypothetical protein ACK5Z0_04850, partial [Planctomycetota bacterium]